MVAELALVVVAAAAAPVEPVGCRDKWVHFHDDPVDLAAAAAAALEQEEEPAVGAEVAAVDTLHDQLADGALAAVRDGSGSDENAAAAAVAAAVASKAVAAADGTTEVAPSSCSGYFAAADDTDDDLDAVAAADEPSFLRIGSAVAAPVALAAVADSGLGQSLANGCFALPVVVPCFAAVDVDGGVADTVAAVAVDTADAAADDDCHPSGLRCCLP